MSTQPIFKSIDKIGEVANGAKGGGFNQYFNDNSSQVNGLVQGAAGAIQFGMEMSDEVNKWKDMEFQEASTSIGGIPSYSGVAALGGQVTGVAKSEAGKGMVGKGAMTGLAVGAAVGNAVPVIGTAIGAVGGAIVGAVTGIFGKAKAKKEQGGAHARSREAFTKSQADYNKTVGGYFDDVNADRQEAQGERAYQRRLYGTNITDPFASIL